MKRLLQFSFLMLMLFVSAVYPQRNYKYDGPDQVIKKIVEIGNTDNQVMRHLDILCNRFGGRLTGSDAYTNAANWAVNEFRKWGLQAELEEAGEVQVGFNRGPWFGKIIKPSDEYLEFATPGYTAGTKGVQRGSVVIAPKTAGEIDAMKDKIKNAWVLIEGENRGYPRDFDSVSAFTQKLMDAGALGTIQSATAPIRVFDVRNVKSFDDLPTLPDIKLLNTQYDKIKAMVEKGEDVQLQFDIRNWFKPGPIKYYSVIAWLPGSEKPDEYVILGGHLDSYDHATGAIDNGSGATPSMEALRIIAKSGAKPKRTIMVQLWANEERGLVGSKAWVKNHPDKLEKISAVLNRDGGTNAIVGISVPKIMMDDFAKVTEPVLNLDPAYPFKLTDGGEIRRAGRGGTDTHSFIMAGVPAFGFRTEGSQVYGTTWHTVLDTYDQAVPEYQEYSTVATAIVAYGLANLDHLLTREGAFLPEGIYADLFTKKGRITLKLDYENVPVTCANFIGLAEGTIKNDAFKEGEPYFRNTVFHRVVPGHVIQAGMPATGKEDEGPGYEFPNEIYKGLHHDKAGMLGMANAGPNTNGSQFYITLADRSYLDGNYTLFGEVVEGIDVVMNIAQGDTISNIRITRIGDKANAFQVNDESFRKMVEEAKAKVKVDEEKKEKEEAGLIEKNWPGAVTMTNGVKYLIDRDGTGDKPANGTKIKVSYTGKFFDGTTFASTEDQGKPDAVESPAEFDYVIGISKINDGLDSVIADMKPGEKRTAIVPSPLGYGISGFYGKSIPGKKRFVISPNTTLIYEIEILK